jgi:S-adenosylmethionine:tRNA ribosyltransferase-isomerase
MVIDFTLPAELEAHDPPEARGLARDGVRMLVSRGSIQEVSDRVFRDLPGLLLPGDLLVVNDTGTLPAAVRIGGERAVHFSTPLPDGAWLVEFRPNGHRFNTPVIDLPGGAALTLENRVSGRLWRARLSVAVVPYLLHYGIPIRYSYVGRDWPRAAYQTVFSRKPGSAEMPSASRPFTEALVTRLVARGIVFAPITLHTGVASPEAHERPYPERFEVPEDTARLVNQARAAGRRIIAVGTTAVRALESATDDRGRVRAAGGFTSLVVTAETGVRATDGLITGFHEPRASHLDMLRAIAGEELLTACYEEALRTGYLWHEFGDINLLFR